MAKLKQEQRQGSAISKMAYCISRSVTQLSNKAAFSCVEIFNGIFHGNWNSSVRMTIINKL